MRAAPPAGQRLPGPTRDHIQTRQRTKRNAASDPVLAAIDRPKPAGVNAAGFGSDVVADALRALDIPYIALNPGASYRGLHDSIVNYLGNERPQMLLCLHEESAVAIAQGWAKVTGKAMAVAVHSNVGLMHATMAIFNAWCDRMPMVILGATGPVDAVIRRPWIDWIHTARDQGALIRGYSKWDDQPASPARRARSDAARGLDRQYRALAGRLTSISTPACRRQSSTSRLRRSTTNASCRRSRARRRRRWSPKPPNCCAPPSVR